MERSTDLRAIDAALSRIGKVANSRRASDRRSARSGVDLPPTAVATLACIYRNGPMRLTAIGERLELEPSRVSREVRRLAAEGFIEQGRDPDDGRALALRVTDAGAEAFQRYRAAADELLADALHQWSDADLHRLAASLAKLAATLGPSPS